MKVDEFSFNLPEELIAQLPASRRDASRLMILDRGTGEVSHRMFSDLLEQLAPGDLLVMNDTKVVPSRLFARKPTGGRVEVLLVEQLADHPGASEWQALLSGSRSIAPGMDLSVGVDIMVVPIERQGDVWRVRLVHPGRDAAEVLESAGELPLPPYIRREPADPRREVDRVRYQTVYARSPGAVAAPTAGLHLTRELLTSLDERGVATAFITLHTGLGTFAPLRVAEVEKHRMHDEAFAIPDATAAAVTEARARGGRVVAVGTTVVRALESRADDARGVSAGSGRSSLFLYPGARFRVVDALLTNFHLPRSTLLMLVCAFAGTGRVLAAYAAAVRERYRFFSYGDAMFVKGAMCSPSS